MKSLDPGRAWRCKCGNLKAASMSFRHAAVSFSPNRCFKMLRHMFRSICIRSRACRMGSSYIILDGHNSLETALVQNLPAVLFIENIRYLECDNYKMNAVQEEVRMLTLQYHNMYSPETFLIPYCLAGSACCGVPPSSFQASLTAPHRRMSSPVTRSRQASRSSLPSNPNDSLQ
jgi:hypothetical protein